MKLFLKGEKCSSPKCPMITKPYNPGNKGKRRTRPLSEYGKELREKQKLRNWYNLGERQFSKYVREAIGSRGKVEDTASFLIETLERRLDNVVFRLGFALSRDSSRQMVSHRHFLVNGRPVNIPSYQTKKGDVVKLRPSSAEKNLFKSVKATLKKYTPPSWLELNVEALEGKVTGKPNLEEALPPAEISSIFEFYSR